MAEAGHPELRARRGDPVGGDRRHRADHLRLLLAGQPRTAGGRVRAHHVAVVGGLHHRVRALPAGGATAVENDRRPRCPRRERQRAPARGRHHPAGPRSALRAAALALRGPLEDGLFGGSETLYWILIVTVLAYAASYFARGFLAGHHRFGLYGGLVLMEASSRCLFALAVAVGIAEGQTAVALGMAAAPIVSLAVVPLALARRIRPSAAPGAQAEPDPGLLDAAARDEPAAREPEFTLSQGSGFAAAVLLIMLCEQTFLNAGPLLIEATRGERRRGAGRLRLQRAADRPGAAPAVPGGADLDPPPPHAPAGGRRDRPVPPQREPHARSRSRVRGSRRAGDARGGPVCSWTWSSAASSTTSRLGLVLIALGHGPLPAAATLNQALLARGPRRRGRRLLGGAAAGVRAVPARGRLRRRVLEVEVAFLGAAACLCGLLYALYRRA